MFILRKIKYIILRIFFSMEEFVERYVIPKANAGRITTTELVKRIFIFCEVYSGKTMYPYQEQFSKRVIRAVLENDGAEITALFARQSGKTEAISITSGGLLIILPQLANMVMFLDDPRLTMFKDGLWIGIFAPTQRQAQITYSRLRSRIQSRTAQAVLNDPEFRLQFSTSNGQTVALTNGSFVTAISASEGSSIEGEAFKLILLDEAQDISNFKIKKSIQPMGAAYNATVVKIGTPTTFKGDFYDAIQRNKADIEKHKNKAEGFLRDHFEYDWKVAVKYNKFYEKYIEKEKKRIGENSDEFRMSYDLEWIIARSMLIDIEEFEKNNVEKYLERQSCDYTATHVAGIDIGGKGDSTVITVVEVDWDMPVVLETTQDLETGEDLTYTAYNTYVKDWYEIIGEADYEVQFDMIMEYLHNFNIVRIVVDATKEASLAHRLRANLPYEVIPFVFSTKSKSDIYKHLVAEIDTGRAKCPGGQQTVQTTEYKKFMEQLAELQKSYSGTHLVVRHSTEGIHDDYPDSLCLAVWGCSMSYQPDNTETQVNRFTQKTKTESTSMKRRNSITAKRR